MTNSPYDLIASLKYLLAPLCSVVVPVGCYPRLQMTKSGPPSMATSVVKSRRTRSSCAIGRFLHFSSLLSCLIVADLCDRIVQFVESCVHLSPPFVLVVQYLLHLFPIPGLCRRMFFED